MLSRDQLLEIISGRTNGIAAGVVRFGLGCLTPFYRIAIGYKNRRFDRAISEGDTSVVKQASIPVISVGNLTTGGTGKTPLVIWIAKKLRQSGAGQRVVLISRGYNPQGDSTGRNDEAIEMEDRLPDVPQLQDPDRYSMAQIVHRDFDVVLIDATNPFGYDRLLPRGLLREPLSSLSRADFIILTRVNLVSVEQSEAVLARIAKLAPAVPIATTQTAFTHLLQANAARFELDTVADRSVFAFCGIGNPENFLTSLTEIDLQICGQTFFPDHHLYSRDDLEAVADQALRAGAAALICTHKDLVKIGSNQIGSNRFKTL